ncbi:GH-E family nuclease [Thermaerobacillus caldiproteolyticus]|uniref:GH-E family nuclease n=1 Tax=Thermaerobacillus caldiproteolyticus TaxID=247480 RepID=UPI00358DCBA7
MRYDANGNRKIKVNKGIYNRKKHYGNGTRKSVRDAVLKRDNYTCQYCGRKGGKLEVDHNPSLKQHYYKKGYAMSRKVRIKYANNPKYLKTACQRCNRSKQERYYPDEWRP